jgi:hypothetical protein
MDFVRDQLATGGKFRILIDTYSRCARAVDPRPAYRGVDVVAIARERLQANGACLSP